MSAAASGTLDIALPFSAAGGPVFHWAHTDDARAGYDKAPIRYVADQNEIGPARLEDIALVIGQSEPAANTIRSRMFVDAPRLGSLQIASAWLLMPALPSAFMTFYGAPAAIDMIGSTAISRFYDVLKAGKPVDLPARSPDVAAFMERIESFRALDPDWAGDDTVIVSQDVADLAGTVVDAVRADGLPLPNPSPSPDGEIGLSWFSNRDRLALTVTRDLHIVWATSINRKVEEGEDLEVSSEFFPRSLIEALRGFYKQAAGSVPLSQRG